MYASSKAGKELIQLMWLLKRLSIYKAYPRAGTAQVEVSKAAQKVK